jgi:hypothetical protein
MTYTVMVGSRKVFEGIGKHEAGRVASVYMQSDNVRFGVSMFRTHPYKQNETSVHAVLCVSCGNPQGHANHA